MSAVLDAATVREIRTVTGLDVTVLPTPGRTVVVAGVGGTGVSSVVRACTSVAPHLAVAEWGSLGSGVSDAAVAMLVLDPSSSVGEEETALLAELRRDVGVVALVCNKIDAHWDWPDTLRAIRSVIDPAGRLPLFGVAAGCGDTGIAALTEWLSMVVSAPDDVRRVLRQAGAGLAVADAKSAPDRGAVASARELADRRRAIVAVRDRGRAERYAAARVEFAAARTGTIGELGAMVRTLSVAAESRCDGLARSAEQVYGTWLDAQLASAADHLDRVLGARLDEAAAVTLAGIGVFAGSGPGPAAQPVVITPVAPAGPRRGAEDALFALLGVSTGFGVGRAVGTAVSSMQTGVPVSALTSVTVLAGLAIAVWVIGVRRTSATRARLRAATAAALTELRTTGERLVLSRSSATELEVTGHIVRHHDRLVRDSARQVAEIDAELGRLRDTGPDTARTRAARALADRLVALADPERRPRGSGTGDSAAGHGDRPPRRSVIPSDGTAGSVPRTGPV